MWLLIAAVLALPLLGCGTSYRGDAAGFQTETEEDESFEKKRARQDEIIRQQQMQMERQQRELEDLERQRYWNQELKRYEDTEQERRDG